MSGDTEYPDRTIDKETLALVLAAITTLEYAQGHISNVYSLESRIEGAIDLLDPERIRRDFENYIPYHALRGGN